MSDYENDDINDTYSDPYGSEDEDNDEVVIPSKINKVFTREIQDEVDDNDVEEGDEGDVDDVDDVDDIDVEGVEKGVKLGIKKKIMDDEMEYDDDDGDEYDIDLSDMDEGETEIRRSKPKTPAILHQYDDDEDDDEENDETFLQKFSTEINNNYIHEFHPECLMHNYEEISKLSIVVRNADGIIIDPLHKTIPYLTKYERARILGQRAKQLETGSKPFIPIPENIVDCAIIAELELKEKKIPFIIKRPTPDGSCEYWKVNDLEMIIF
jgi:DNA-directed RNA polymerase I, II, and III subunit RPABC2